MIELHYQQNYTSSAVLATASKPIYAKNTVAEPASIPSTPKGKYLSNQEPFIQHTLTKGKKGSEKKGSNYI